MHFDSVVSVTTATNANERPTIARTSRIFLLVTCPFLDFWHPTRKRSILKNDGGDYKKREKKRIKCTKSNDTQRKQYLGYVNDPQPGVVQELYPWTAMCVRNVDVHVSCSSHVDAQLAAFFIDPRAKWSTVQGNRIFLFYFFILRKRRGYPDTESFFFFFKPSLNLERTTLLRSMVAEPIRLKKFDIENYNSFRYILHSR